MAVDELTMFICCFHVMTLHVKKSNFCFCGLLASDDNTLIGPEGMEKFCEDIGVEPENVRFRIMLS